MKGISSTLLPLIFIFELERQTPLADNVCMEAKKEGVRPLGVEGENPGEWVLVDFGDVVVHVMLPATRDFYDLERLWVDTRPSS